MLKYIGPNPDRHVLGGVLFTLNAEGQVLTAQDAVTLEPAIPEQVRKAEEIAPRFPKFWQLLPDHEDPRKPEDEADDEDGDEPNRLRRRRKHSEE